MASASYLAAVGLPWVSGLTHWGRYGSIAHPLVSLIVLTAIFVLIARAFRRKPG